MLAWQYKPVYNGPCKYRPVIQAMQDINPGTAVDDTWSDPMSQYLAYTAADEVYRFLGKEGFVHPDRMPKAGDTFQEGTIGFHLRSGTHFHSRYDWQQYMVFMKKHRIRGRKTNGMERLGWIEH